MKTLLFSAAIISASIFTSCNNETLISESASETNSALSLNVSELAYTPTATGSRAVTNTDAVKTTEFEEGDALGLFIISEDGTVTKQNVKFTYTSGIWTPDGVVNYYANSNYIAYFPYEKNLTVESSSDIETVIKTYFTENNFTSKDQSSKEAYQKADLMMAKLEKPVGPAISFPLKHQFSMVEISIPVRKYITIKTYDEAGTRFEYCAPHKVTWDTLTYNDNGITPYYAGNGVYRYIAVSATGAADVVINGSVIYEANQSEFNFNNSTSQSVPLSSGSYVSYNLNNPAIPSDVTKRDLEVGDYYYSDGSIYPYGKQNDGNDLSSPLTEGCIGVVFQVEDHLYTQTQSDNIITKTAVVGVTNTEWIHGNVIALKNLQDSKIAWGSHSTGIEGNIYSGVNDYGTNIDMLVDMRGYDLSHNDHFKNELSVKYALEYSEIYPSTSSGWYMPSAGQMMTFWINLGEYKLDMNKALMIGDGNSEGQKSGCYTKLLSHFTAIDSSLGEVQQWWTVTENYDSGPKQNKAWTFKVNGNKTGFLDRKKDTNQAVVRPVLSF